jgi:hypothetical protein
MKKNPLFIFLFVFSLLSFTIFSFFCSHKSYSQIPKGIYKIEGLWETKNEGATIYEQWKVNPDSTLEGKIFSIKNEKDTVLLKTMRIISKDDTAYYVIKTFDQDNDKPVYYKIIEFTPMVFVFENKQQNFPQMITYSVKTSDLYAVIFEGPDEGNKIKSIEYRFTRKIE